MPQRGSRSLTGTNTAGHVKVTDTTPQRKYARDDFFRDLKKVAKKQDRPSRPDQEKR